MVSGPVALHAPAEAAAAAPVRAEAGGRRLRLVELLLVGGASVVLFPLAWLLRAVVGLDDGELAIGFLTFHLAFVVNDPHFSVTYLLFYRDVRKRAASSLRYVIAGFVVPAALATWAAVALALHSAQTLGWMIQLMFLLVGWHYVKQGFGVLNVLSARRGVRIRPRERTAILVHCYAGWAFAWANPAAEAGEFEEKGVVYRALAHPRWLELATGAALALSTLALAWALVTSFRRERRVLPLAPLGVFLITVWSWTIFSSLDPIVRYAIPALHSIQYLYFVWLMKRNEALSEEGPPSFGRPVRVRLGVLALSALGLAWLLFHGVPDFLDAAFVPRSKDGVAADALGETPFFAAAFVIVNIHHYFMDSVIWRRDNPDTRFLRA